MPISSRKENTVKPPAKPVNAFQRLLNNSSLLTAASSEDNGGDDVDDVNDDGDNNRNTHHKISIAESILTRAPSSHGTLRDHIQPAPTTFQAQDFQNVQFFCRNAGSTEEVLRDFQAAVVRTGFVGVSLLWADLSSNHAPLSENPETITASTVTHINDPKVAAYLLSPEIDDASSLDLTSMLAKHRIAINHTATFTCDPSQIVTKGRIAEAIFQAKAELIAVYQLAQHLVHSLHEQQLTSVFQNLEMPLSFQLGTLEAVGVAIDVTKLSILREQLDHHLRTVTQEIYALSTLPHPQFNIASPEQISHLLFQQLRLKPPKSALESSTGKFLSTSEETLKQMKDQHPIVEWILTFRSLFKLLHTYIEGLEPFIRNSTSAGTSGSSSSSVHASWNQLIVRTGRLSCSKPNLQNIPTNFSLPQLAASSPAMHDLRIRAFFIARAGYKLVAVDYSQIEMRVLAHVTGDMDMCRLFRDRGGDIYKLLASKIFRKATLDAVTDAERTQAKVICLGCIYGMGPVAAAARLGIDVATVSQITTSFFRSFRGVSQWIQRIRQYARTHQEVRTLSGRLRRLLDIQSENPIKRAAAERQAVNTVIQGTASDLIKSAMLLTSGSTTTVHQRPSSSSGGAE
eukprot:gene423-278_t